MWFLRHASGQADRHTTHRHTDLLIAILCTITGVYVMMQTQYSM